MTRTRATVSALGGSLPRAATNARARWQRRDGLLLRLADDAGRVGHGEASPLPGYSPDSLDECREALAVVVRAPPAPLDPRAPLLPQLADRIGPIDDVAPLPPAARIAVETALLDLAGARSGSPLWSLLARIHAEAGEVAPTEGTPAPVPISVLIDTETPRRALSDARAALARGVRTLKCKIGRPGAFEAELSLLRSLRRDLGARAALRLDANGAFSFEDAPSRLAALALLGPELVEEPTAGRLGALAARLPRVLQPQQIPPLAADETLQHPLGLDAIGGGIRSGVICAVVLKPTALGGLLRCVDLARRAREAGADAIVTHTFDGPIALAAAAALALALPPSPDGTRRAAGLDKHAALAAWPATPLPFLDGSTIVAWRSPGLGLSEGGEP